jgi:hypothetical protein
MCMCFDKKQLVNRQKALRLRECVFGFGDLRSTTTTS